MGSLAMVSVTRRPLARELQSLEAKFIKLGIEEKGGILANIEFRFTFIEDIKSK